MERKKKHFAAVSQQIWITNVQVLINILLGEQKVGRLLSSSLLTPSALTSNLPADYSFKMSTNDFDYDYEEFAVLTVILLSIFISGLSFVSRQRKEARRKRAELRLQLVDMNKT